MDHQQINSDPKRDKQRLLELHRDLAELEAAGVPGAAEGRRAAWEQMERLELVIEIESDPGEFVKSREGALPEQERFLRDVTGPDGSA